MGSSRGVVLGSAMVLERMRVVLLIVCMTGNVSIRVGFGRVEGC